MKVYTRTRIIIAVVAMFGVLLPAHNISSRILNGITYAFDSYEIEEWFDRHKCPADVQHPWKTNQKVHTHATSQRNKKKRIALVSFVDDFAGVEYRIMTTQNKAIYCKQWNITFINFNPSTPEFQQWMQATDNTEIHWMKFEIVHNHLPKYDFVFYMDSDAIFKNFNIDVNKLATQMINNDKFLAISQDLFNVNSGVFLMRNCDVAFRFLEQAKTLQKFLQQELSWSAMHIFKEQEMFYYLLNMWPQSKHWQSGWWSPIKPFFADYTLYQNKTMIVPRCLFNQILLSWSPQRFTEISDHAFIVHCVGHAKQTCVREQLLHTL